MVLRDSVWKGVTPSTRPRMDRQEFVKYKINCRPPRRIESIRKPFRIYPRPFVFGKLKPSGKITISIECTLRKRKPKFVVYTQSQASLFSFPPRVPLL